MPCETLFVFRIMGHNAQLPIFNCDEEGLRRAVQEAHHRYTGHVNRREVWRGYLWQGRIASCRLDEAHLLAAARYVELNPVRARLKRRARDWRWSSARAHLACKDDGVVWVQPPLDLRPDWRAFLGQGMSDAEADALRRGERAGRPLGGDPFGAELERRTGRELRKGRPGPKRAGDGTGN